MGKEIKKDEVVVNKKTKKASTIKKKYYGYDGIGIVEVKTKAEALTDKQLKSFEGKLAYEKELIKYVKKIDKINASKKSNDATFKQA